MSDKNTSSFGFSSFASLRKSAQELGAKAAASVSEYQQKKKDEAGNAVATTDDDAQTEKTATVDVGAAGDSAAPASTTSASTTTTDTAAATTPPAASAGSSKSDDVSKENLMEILSKMNKKVKALSLARQQLTQQVEAEKHEKERVLALVQDEILNEPSLDPERDVVLQLQSAWRVKEEAQALTLQTLQSEFQKMQVQQQQQQQTETLEDWQEFKKLMIEQHDKEIAQLKQQLESTNVVGNGSSSNNNASSVPPPDDSRWEEEKKQLVEQHNKAIAELTAKVDAADQKFNTFRQKVSAARQVEVEKLKSERQAAVEQTKQQSQETIGQLQQQIREKEALLQAKTEELEQNQVSFVEQLSQKEAELQTQQQAAAADGDEKTRVVTQQLQEHQTNAERLQSEIASLQAQLADKDKASSETATAQQAEVGKLQAELQSQQQQLTATMQSERQQMSEAHQRELEAQKSALEGQHQAAVQTAVQETQQRMQKQIGSLQEKVKDMDVALDTKQKQMEQIQSTHSEQLAQKDAELKAQQQQAAANGDEKLRAVMKTLQEHQSKATTLQNEVGSLNTQLADKDKVLEETKAAHSKQLQQTESDLLEQHQSAITEHTAKLQAATEQLQQLQTDATRSKEESSAQLNEKNQLLAAKAKELEEARETHGKQLKEKEAELVAQHTAAATESSEKLRSAMEQLQQQQVTLQQSQEESSRLKSQLSEKDQLLSEKDSGISTLKEQLTKSKADLAAQMASTADGDEKQALALEQLQKQQSQLDESLAKKDSELNQAHAELRTIKAQSEEQAKSISQAKAQHESLEAEKKELEGVASALKTELSTKDELLVSKEAEIGKVKADLHAANAERQKHSSAAVDVEKHRSALEEEKQQLVNLTKDLKRQLSEKESLLVSKDKELTTAQVAQGDELSSVKSELAREQEKALGLEKQLQSQQQGAETQKRDIEQRLQALQTQVSEKDQQLAAKGEEMEKTKTAHEEQLAKTKTQLAHKAKAIMGEQLQKQQAAGEEEKRVLVQQIDELKSRVSEQDKSMAAKEEEHEKQLAKTKSIFAEQAKAAMGDQLKQQQERLDGEKQELSQQIEELKTSISEKDALLEAKEKEMTQTRAAFDNDLVKMKSELEEQAKASIDASEAEKFKEDLAVAKQEHEAQLKKLEQQHVTELENKSAAIDTLKKEQEDAVSAIRAKAAADVERQTSEARTKAQAEAAAHEKEKEETRKKMEEYVDNMTTQFKTKLKAIHDKAAAEAKRLQTEKDETATKLNAQLRTASLSATALKNENEDLRSRLARAKEEMKMTVENNSATATSLIEQQERLEREKGDLEALCKRLEQDNQVKSKSLEELGGKATALEQNLNSLTEERKELEQKLQAAARQESKLKTSQAEVADLREQLNKLKLEGTKNANLVARLQAEKDSNERSHGERTALVAMLEAQLAEMNEKNADVNAKMEAAVYDLSQKDETIVSQQEQISRLEKELLTVKETAKRTSETLALAQKSADSKSNKQVEALQRELQSTRQQMAKKSAAAQKLFQEREAECSELRKQNKALQQEVDKGTLSDRRIFELAAKQSNRESQQAEEIKIRDRVIENLKLALLERDGDLAFFEKHVQEVEGQVEELCRVRRREDVNLDYLKSIVVKYLSLPPASSERARLLPVLATLLQFNNDDYQTIEEGKQKLSWWGDVMPTLIGSAEPVPPATSAEVALSNGAPSRPATNTSLQF